jgi:hypothetical protein
MLRFYLKVVLLVFMFVASTRVVGPWMAASPNVAVSIGGFVLLALLVVPAILFIGFWIWHDPYTEQLRSKLQ